MNQGKLKVIKQEMTRVNIILGICELKWTVMGEFSSDDNKIHSCQQEHLRRNGAILSQQESEIHYLGATLKMTE